MDTTTNRSAQSPGPSRNDDLWTNLRKKFQKNLQTLLTPVIPATVVCTEVSVSPAESRSWNYQYG